MKVKEHYDKHLSDFYAWMLGDFELAKNTFKEFCSQCNIKSENEELAVDLGAGHGIQTIALSELGYRVKAIDFNDQLLMELKSKIETKKIEVIQGNIIHAKEIVKEVPNIIACCGDTISHLETFEQLEMLLFDCFNLLPRKGKLILTFRDYTEELMDTQRFIPVKSDQDRILTCVLEYSRDKVKVTDLLHVRNGDNWVQKVSSYDKLRITTDYLLSKAKEIGFVILESTSVNRMIHLLLEK